MDEPQGALSQLNPATAMVPTASGGNPAVAQMMQSMLQQSQDKQGYLQQQRDAYNKDMEKYAAQVQQQQEQGDASADWGGMANAASSVAPTWGNIGAMLGRVGGAHGEAMSAERNRNLASQAQLVKMRQDEVRALESKDQQAAMLRALTSSTKVAQPTIKVVDGKLVSARMNPETGEMETEVLTGSQDQIKARMFQNFYNKAVDNEVPDPEAYAQAQTEKTLAQFGGTTVKGEANNIPGVKPAATSAVPSVPSAAPSMQVTLDEQKKRDAAAVGLRAGEQNGTLPDAPANAEVPDVTLSPEDAALARRLMARIQANPAASANDTATLNKMMQKYETAPPMQYLDKPKRKMEEGTATVEGKALGEEHQALNVGYRNSGQQASNLDLLEKIFSNPNIPEGELGPLLQRVRSGLKSAGIEVGEEVGQAGLADALSKEIALKKRTEGGQNLLPGAMSNYEDTLLQSMSPGLLSTNEGRLAQIKLMRAATQSNMRFAEEANKMADANRGILPSEWNKRRERITKEEMARLALVNRDVLSTLKGAK